MIDMSCDASAQIKLTIKPEINFNFKWGAGGGANNVLEGVPHSDSCSALAVKGLGATEEDEEKWGETCCAQSGMPACSEGCSSNHHMQLDINLLAVCHVASRSMLQP